LNIAQVAQEADNLAQFAGYQQRGFPAAAEPPPVPPPPEVPGGDSSNQ